MKLNRTIPKLAMLVAATAVGFTACSEQGTTSALPSRTGTEVPLKIEVSSSSAARGSRVAIAVNVDAGTTNVGVVQGALTFDVASLRYVGQSPVGTAIAVVNNKGAAGGALRFAAFNPKGINDRVAVFVFEVKAPNYMSSLRYVPELAAATGGRHFTTQALGAFVSEGLTVPSDAAMMTIADWSARIVPAGSAPPTVSAAPGEYRENLRYGDVDLNGTINGDDFLAVANAAVGNDQIIIGTNGPVVDRDLVIAGNVFPTNAAGVCGNNAPVPPSTESLRVLNGDDFLAIANFAVGSPETCAGTLIPGRGPLPGAGARAIVTGNITGARLFSKDTVYELQGQVRILDGAVLTVQAGTRVEGSSVVNPSALISERGGVLLAAGTQYEPIVFTCTGTKVPGCWGGVWLSGKSAPNVGVPATGTGLGPSPAFAARSITFQGTTYNVAADAGGCNQLLGEANTPAYGGCTDNDFSGVLRYAVIEFGGFTISLNRELNGLTLAGVGSQTVIENVQVHGGSDDGVEFFAGTVGVRNVLITGAQDDGFDGSFGYRGNSQFVIVQNDQGDTPGNDSRAIEFDGNETTTNFAATPRTSAGMYNFTVIGNLTSDGQTAAILFRRGTQPTISNSIFHGWRFMVEVRDPETCSPAAPTIRYSTFVGWRTALANPSAQPAVCPAPEESIITLGTSNLFRQTSGPQIGGLLIDAINTQLPDFRNIASAAENISDPAVPAGILNVAYRGAVAPQSAGQIPWYSGWTRGFTTPTTP